MIPRVNSAVFLLGAATLQTTAFSLDTQCPFPTHLHHQEQPQCEITPPRNQDSNNTSSHHPWTHPPLCFSSPQRTYCTYTHHLPFPSHDLSIISTPSAAHLALQARAHASQSPPQSDHSSSLQVRSTPHKGKALFATRRLPATSLLLYDSPALIASAQLPLHASATQGHALFAAAASLLDAETRASVLALDGGEVQDILKTNSFACQLADGEAGDGYMCLFPRVARINHACRPNAYAKFEPATLRMRVVALREIEQGEEVSISYGRVELPYVERRRLYQEGWGFECGCEMCAKDGKARGESDRKRERFRALKKILEEVTAETFDAGRVLEWEEEVLKLSEEEGLEVLVAEDMERLAYVYAGMGDVRRAKEWARKARENLLLWTVAEGRPDFELKRVEELLRELGA